MLYGIEVTIRCIEVVHVKQYTVLKIMSVPADINCPIVDHTGKLRGDVHLPPNAPQGVCRRDCNRKEVPSRL